MTGMRHKTSEIERQQNWAGNIVFGAWSLETPKSAAAIQELIAISERVKGLGGRHSFSPVADTKGTLVAPQLDTGAMQLDVARSQVTIPAGVRYGEAAVWLTERGFALPNLASLPHITVVGACATATHGSGVTNGNLATSIRALEIVTGSGDLRTLSREQDGDDFDGMVVHLGALGIVTSVTLEVVPAFTIAQTVYENLPYDSLLPNFDQIMSGAYSVSLFTDWRTAAINQVWIKERVSSTEKHGLPNLFGALPASQELHPVAGISAESCTQQLGVPGAWYERLPHFKIEHTPSVGDELQTEYFISRENAPEAIRRLSTLSGLISPQLLISEIRAVAADRLWLSPNYCRDSVGIHFTWKKDMSAVLDILPRIEAILEDLRPTPHWAKLSTMAPEKVRERFPRLPDFQRLARSLDPDGRCINQFLRRFVM